MVVCYYTAVLEEMHKSYGPSITSPSLEMSRRCSFFSDAEISIRNNNSGVICLLGFFFYFVLLEKFDMRVRQFLRLCQVLLPSL